MEKYNTVQEYINSLPTDRIIVINKLRETIIKNLPEGYVETIEHGILAFVVPHSLYPNGYHCNTKEPLPFISLASQKKFIALYHIGIYANKELLNWFTTEYPKYCTSKLDMGKSCIRFKNIDQIPYELIANLCKKLTVNQWIEIYESQIKTSKK